ncbi:hypothetical protein F503_00837 [Ophiostoma piceae UAMH 11346]|uniref:DUF7924 domain-containing protein n=1 Tax=Ophiostoma piceae (strain UAMH 11346) TaxID=1262450 RepID=S3C3E7_OPHP1|nr:hypothetical protein F503_00837 [Ophiostoma piceae UAMH 11346]
MALAVSRSSLSASTFLESAFETFQASNARAKDENDVLASVIPTIIGPYRPTHASARNTVFKNLEPLTDGTIAPAVPDIYYGAHPEDLCRSVRDELTHHIMPSTMKDKPLVPNFFIEVKGPDGSAAVATRQARYDGAAGSRAMHSLQNYEEEGLQYDGQAYTFSSIYHGGTGTLQLYAHHLTAPTTEGGRPEYHMTQLRTFSMINSRDTYIQGATRDNNETLQQHITHAIRCKFREGSEAAASPQPLRTESDSNGPGQSPVAQRVDPSISFTSSFRGAKRPMQMMELPSQSGGNRSSKRRRSA